MICSPGPLHYPSLCMYSVLALIYSVATDCASQMPIQLFLPAGKISHGRPVTPPPIARALRTVMAINNAAFLPD